MGFADLLMIAATAASLAVLVVYVWRLANLIYPGDGEGWDAPEPDLPPDPWADTELDWDGFLAELHDFHAPPVGAGRQAGDW